MLSVVFYQSSAGRVPVLEWLRNLDTADRQSIGADLHRVQMQWPLGMPLCKNLSGGLWEVRCTLQGGRIARLLFCLRGSDIIVLHGFFKSTQMTPMVDLKIAKKRMKEVMR